MGVALSSAADIARHLMVHGLGHVMHDGLVPLINNLKGFKMSVKEAKLAGTVSERILYTRMATWGELIDPYNHRSPVERFLSNTARGFSKVNGMVYWNDFQKSFASVLTQARVLRGAENYAGLKPRERAYLAYLGIDEDMAQRIAKEFQNHGSLEGGVRVANSPDWSDDLARRTYRAAINKDVDSTIVTKGVGDTPLFSHTPLGRMALQFQGFTLAAHQRAFIRGMQERPAGMLSGVIAATAIGMMIYYLKMVEGNNADKISDNPGHWVAEGLDRSGLFPLFFEANDTIEKFSGDGAYHAMEGLFPGYNQTKPVKSYSSSPSGLISGPTGQYLDGLWQAFNGARHEINLRLGVRDQNGNVVKGFTKGDINAIKNLIPFGSLPIIKSLMDYVAVPEFEKKIGVQ